MTQTPITSQNLRCSDPFDVGTPSKTCPLCGQPVPFPALRPMRPWTPEVSALLDWLEQLSTDLQGLRRAVEEAAL